MVPPSSTAIRLCSRCLFILCLGISLSCLPPALLLAAPEKKTVLFLNSYHNGYKWSDSLLDGVRQVLDGSEYKVDLQIEYMDVKRFDYDNIAPTLFDLYREKFRDKTFDVIVLSDNDALNFINLYRDRLFPGVPVVFCGINDLKESDTASGKITGVVENYDLISTFKIAKKLHPDKKRAVVLIDNSTAGRTIRQQAEKMIEENHVQLQVEYWIQLSLEEAQNRVSHLGDDTFLFIAPYYQTINGRFYTSEEVCTAIYNHSSVPIYTSWQFLVGYGAVGGRVLSGIDDGRLAGKMALDILGGRPVETIPIINEPGGSYYFDYLALKKLRIDLSLLPKEATIINAPKAFYSLSKEVLATIMISFALLVAALIATIVAMLERRKVERKISDQLKFQETLMDSIPQLISWKNVSGQYLGANRAFLDFFATKDIQSLVDKNTVDIIADESFAAWSINSDNAVTSRKSPVRKVKRKVIRQTGEEGWLEINKVPLFDQSDRLVGILSTAENITKEQSLEEQLRQSQKMEAIGTLAGGISHDFNNILTSIMNSTELALTDIPPGTQTEADLRRVLKAAARGGQLVKQILAFSRPSREGFKATNLAPLVHEVVTLLQASMPTNIKVVFDRQPRESFSVHADPTQMHQALLNLCTNAFHALRNEGGVITISLSKTEDMLNDPESGKPAVSKCVRLTVHDNGPGIAADIIDRIFDPFFTTKGKTEGTGLGLAVVHGIIKNHNGSIKVQSSAAARETTFEILLPAIENWDSEEKNATGAARRMHGAILFVEDDADQLATTPRLLEERGFSVLAHDDPFRAIAQAANGDRHIDLLLTDFDMPQMSGTELASQLPHLPVILISGRNDALAAAQGIANIRQVLIKPYNINELIAAITAIITKNREGNGKNPHH